MSHELSITTTGKAEMAFVGSTPWHGLGQSLSKGASLDTWAMEAGMDWTAISKTPMFHVDGEEPPELHEVPTHKVLYRSDTNAPLSIVGEGYQVVQPREVLGFFREMVESGGWYIHTAGVLRGGRKLWAMATRTGGMQSVLGNDPIFPNVLCATSLDGSMRTTAKLTAVRVVCANTVAMALGSAGKDVQISHRSVFNPRAIQRALGLADDSFSAFMTTATKMAKSKISQSEARTALDVIFFGEEPVAKKALDLSWLSGLGQQPVIPDDARESRVVGRTLELFNGEGRGSQNKGAAGTRWGLLNAVTELVDHEMGRGDDTRLDSAWFGRGDGFKSAALKVLSLA